MKIKLLFIVLILCSFNIIFGQVNEDKSFVYLFSGSIIYGTSTEYKLPIFGTSHLIVDSKKISSHEVKFYNNRTGFYANTKKVNASGTSSFSRRIRKGKINLYEKETTQYTPGHFNSTTGIFTGGMTTRIIKNYYNIGYGPLKKANYQNLSIDLSSKPQSMVYLDKYKTVNNTQTALYIIGGATLIAGFATLINKTKDWDGSDSQPEPNVTGSLIAIGVGTGSFCVSYYLGFKKPKHLRSAIDAYNK